MVQFSSTLSSRGLPTSVASQQDVDALAGGFQEYLKELNLWQYYVLNVDAERASVKRALDEGKVAVWDGPPIAHKDVAELAEIMRSSGKVHGLRKLEKKFGTFVDGPVAVGFVKAAFVDLGDDSDALADAWVRVVDVVNVPLYQEWEEDTKVALDNVKNRLKYTRLDEHGPRLGPISEK